MTEIRNQAMLLSTPNSGTDWLAPLFARYGGVRYYDKEFFNPICNERYCEELLPVFGCELLSCYRLIAVPWELRNHALLELVYQKTWLRQSPDGGEYSLDKENFGAWMVPFYAQRFRCAMLFREWVDPSRARVLAWYDAIWHSCVHHGSIYSSRTRTRSSGLRARAEVAHAACWNQLRAEAARWSIPIMRYDVLMEGSAEEVRLEVDKGWIPLLDVKGLTSEILATRGVGRYDRVTAGT